ncbi:GntR family transcriptional regulator [Solirubrobacter sp. CPCC 204708]|uniref:GntR family transcriptional regulator n=1 Tax=Solirubrobacter deserti TaxID=2282478 RepID=A0ABT4RJP2_9ACTN|nr:GntR family transcriptional regulator [Solirubrobacter deserti]MBE2319742.1 GntR family transcriptional regulator [Solirubrobacter deserti]MDA0138777.1 GntR family transcriptional regulator [Solirubrobacter deserti]
MTVRRLSLVDQVRRGLLDDLVLGTLSPGDKLPNEDKLGERFGVSRATVREAVLGLLEAGYLTRRHGSGTYVAEAPRSRHPLESIVDYAAAIEAAGHTATVRTLKETVRAATPEEFEHLHADTVTELERVRLADGRPVIYSRDRHPANTASPTHLIRRASAHLMPTLADEHLAQRLDIAPGSPLLQVDQIAYDAPGRAVMLSLEWHVGDAFELILNRRASAD